MTAVATITATAAAATAAPLAETTAGGLSLDTTTRLRSGGDMPLFGLGTWLSEGNGEAKEAVTSAIKEGYRLIDTASMYKNEADVGAAIAEAHAAGKPSPFVVSKLQPDDHGREQALAAIDRTLANLGVEKLDLWLMHTPSGGRVVETYKAMLEARDAGKCAAVGVSNFGAEQIEALQAAGCELPAVNQFELHVFNQQRPTVEYCRRHGIAVMSFCPLARCKLFGQTGLSRLAEATGQSEASLCLRWLLQRGFVTIPKSTRAERIRENAAVVSGFALTDEQMAEIDALDQGFEASNAVRAMKLPWEDVK